MVSTLASFLAACSTVAALLIGASAVVSISGFVFYLSFKFARHWLNKAFQDLVDLHGIDKVRAAICRMDEDA